MLVTDHPHLFETGGENYHTDFTAWAYLRGHESDPWRTRPDPTRAGPAPPPCPRRRPCQPSPTTGPGPGFATRRTSPAPAPWQIPSAPNSEDASPPRYRHSAFHMQPRSYLAMTLTFRPSPERTSGQRATAVIHSKREHPPTSTRLSTSKPRPLPP
jgi:hypothetical protein